MPRGPQILTPQQQRLLEEARAAHLAHDAVERTARAEYDTLMAQRTAPQRAALARAVATAISHGVPKSRVNVEALGTTTPNAYQRWLDLAQAYADPALPAAYAPVDSAPELPEAPAPSPSDYPVPASLRAHEFAEFLAFAGDPRERRLRVTWPGYPSSAPDAPTTLEGIAVYDPSAPTKWRAEFDPQDKQTQFGVETGAFTFEVEQRRGAVSLRQALASYIEAADLPPYEAPGLDVDEDDDDGF